MQGQKTQQFAKFYIKNIKSKNEKSVIQKNDFSDLNFSSEA